MSYQKRSKEALAQRVAQDIHDGAYVNLGMGPASAPLDEDFDLLTSSPA